MSLVHEQAAITLTVDECVALYRAVGKRDDTLERMKSKGAHDCYSEIQDIAVNRMMCGRADNSRG